MNLFKRIMCVVALAGAALASGSAVSEPLKIRIGWSTMPGHMIPVLFSKPEILKHYGKSYTVETTLFRGSSLQLTAMAAEEIDMGAFSALALDLAVDNAHQNLKVVADMLQDGVDGHHSETFMVRSDSGINKIEDMKGKRVGTNAIGSASDTAIRAMFLKHGMQDKRDYTVVEAAFPNIPAMLESGKIDLGTVLQPTSDQLIATGKYRPLFRAKDAIGPSQLVFLTARADFLDKNRAALNDFFEDYVRAFRWFEDPANKKEAVAIVAKFMNQDPAKLDYIFTKRDYYRDPFMFPNIKTIQSSIDVSREVGLIKKGIKVDPNYVDLSFVQEAKRRILADKH